MERGVGGGGKTNASSGSWENLGVVGKGTTDVKEGVPLPLPSPNSQRPKCTYLAVSANSNYMFFKTILSQ